MSYVQRYMHRNATLVQQKHLVQGSEQKHLNLVLITTLVPNDGEINQKQLQFLHL